MSKNISDNLFDKKSFRQASKEIYLNWNWELTKNNWDKEDSCEDGHSEKHDKEIISNQMIVVLNILVCHQHSRQHKPDSNAELEANVYNHYSWISPPVIVPHLVPKHPDGGCGAGLVRREPRGGQLGRDAQDEDLTRGHNSLAWEQNTLYLCQEESGELNGDRDDDYLWMRSTIDQVQCHKPEMYFVFWRLLIIPFKNIILNSIIMICVNVVNINT